MPLCYHFSVASRGHLKISVSINERIATLRLRHKELDRIIEEEQQQPWPDDPLIKNLKRQKLRIKDRIAAIEIGSSNGGHAR